MTKVIGSEVTNANSSNIDNLETVMDSSASVISSLNGFIYESPKYLKGGGYDAVRTKLSLYVKVFNALNQVTTNYRSLAKNANNSMLNYMEGYGSLDDKKLDEYKYRLKQIEGYLRYLREKASSVDNNTDYTSSINYWTDIYKQLNHYKELLENLGSTDARLFNAFSLVTTDIENVSRCIMGINDNTFTQEGMEAFRKNKAALYTFDPKINIFGYKIDTSKMSSNAKKLLEQIMENWPDGMETQRLIAIETALSLLDKGIQYSQPWRHAINKQTGLPSYMDCSSFVTYCLRAAGIDVPAGAYTGTYLSSKNFTSVNSKNLKPGDVALYNTSTAGGSSNHIGMYLGTDSQGRQVWIHCSGGGVQIAYGPRGFKYGKRYTNYDDTYQV